MTNKIDFFWELFEAVSGGTGAGITDTMNALAKSDRAKLEAYFSDVIDQKSFNTTDYNRLRKLFINLFATHRTLTSQSKYASDPHSMSNSDLDELFRSFGYPHSSQLRGVDENTIEQKIQFFLDLINLYKVKGTPQSLVDVLQYYGVTEIDIYEFLLKLKSPNELVFDGKVVAGTSISPNALQIPYANLTSGDPHWLYTSQQILQLKQTNKINFPTPTPYLGIQPIVDLDGAEFSIISRTVQDQFDYWNTHGVVESKNAEITYFGIIESFLELYLSTIYVYNKLFISSIDQDPCSFLCYNGTNTNSSTIITEFNTITSPIINRCDLNSNEFSIIPPLSDPNLIVSKSYCDNAKLKQYFDTFTRDSSSNFLVDKNSAGNYLQLINPTLKYELDLVASNDLLISLLNNVANWVRINIGYGFINFGYILYGLSDFFKDLKPVINFFKPYRARLLILESLQIKNRLFNKINLEDSMMIDLNYDMHDFMTGDSTPCCVTSSTGLPSCLAKKCHRELLEPVEILSVWKGLWDSNNTNYLVGDVVTTGVEVGKYYRCIMNHLATSASSKPGVGIDWSSFWNEYSELVCTDTTDYSATVYARETFDCGSHFDVGLVTDISRNMELTIEHSARDMFRCPSDGSAFIVSEITTSTGIRNSSNLEKNYRSHKIYFNETLDIPYHIGGILRNAENTPSLYNFIVTEKTPTTLTIELSGLTDSDTYYLDWHISDSTASGFTNLDMGMTQKTINISGFCDSTDYSIGAILVNDIDSSVSVYAWNIIDKQEDNFTVKFSAPMDSSNYIFEWFICDSIYHGTQIIPEGLHELSIDIPMQEDTTYTVLYNMISDQNGSIYAAVVTDKSKDSFRLEFSGVIDTTGSYYIHWIIPPYTPFEFDFLEYYQTSGFRNFDSEGSFDCTHGFDHIEITVEVLCRSLLQENGFNLLQENYEKLCL